MPDIPSALAEALQDRYLLERELGRGGMATVYLAQDLKHDRPVALKVLHPELAASLGPDRFQREIKLAARLQHPHILTVHDSGETAGQVWFTMPYVEGESLRDRLKREHQLSVEDTVRIGREAALALEYAHQHGVIHRDIKPENLLQTKDGSTLIADFGIARALAAGDAELTGTGMAIGTPAYMSPEQASAEKTIDARTDIYSLGAVLYEMLAGEPPYTGPTAQAIILKRFTEPVPSVRRGRPSVPEGVDQAIQRALAPIAADRFATAAEFARSLQPIVTVATTAPTAVATPVAPPAAPGAPTSPLVTRVQRFPVAAIALGLGFLIGLGVLFAWRRTHPGASESAGPKVLAVLPFENLGDSADAYFADGMTDEVRGKLASIPGLQVIASTSSNRYRHSDKNPQEIGRQLGARYLLFGRVRWAKIPGATSRVRVDPELMQVADVPTPTTKWEEAFDAPLTDVFSVQADIASKVAQALRVRLTPAVHDALSERPTRNLDAYDAYLRGRELMQVGDQTSQEQAVTALTEAVHRDSTFALAWALLARAHGVRYIQGPREPAEAEAMHQMTARALALAPDLPEGHAREGEYQSWIRHDNVRALAAYQAGLRQAPNNALLLNRTGWAEMRLGRWDAAVAHFTQARRLDPRSGVYYSDLGMLYLALRRYAEARAAEDTAAALLPASVDVISRRIAIELSAGNVAVPASVDVISRRIAIELSAGNVAAARAILRSAPASVDQGTLLVTLPIWALDSQQLTQLTATTLGQFGGDDGHRSLALSEAYQRLGDTQRARAYADSARVRFEIMRSRTPDDADVRSRLAFAYAYLGRKADAVQEAQRAVALVPIAADALAGPALQEQLARIELTVGEPNKAITLLEPLLNIPGWLSRGRLRIDPTFAPLRGNPRFARLVVGK